MLANPWTIDGCGQSRVDIQTEGIGSSTLLLAFLGSNFIGSSGNDTLISQQVCDFFIQHIHDMVKVRSLMYILRPAFLHELDPGQGPSRIRFRTIRAMNDTVRMHLGTKSQKGSRQCTNLPEQNTKTVGIDTLIVWFAECNYSCACETKRTPNPLVSRYPMQSTQSQNTPTNSYLRVPCTSNYQCFQSTDKVPYPSCHVDPIAWPIQSQIS
jgi:hypothetical protein